MKSGLLIMAILISTFALAKDNQYYSCTAKLYRSDMGVSPVHSVFYFWLTKEDNGSLSIGNFVGHALAGSAKAEEAHYSIFNIVKPIAADTTYKPTKYKGSVRFSNIDSLQSSSSYEEGMWGQLVVEKAGKTSTPAHFIFKAGDHQGGTIDYDCTTSN